jgi:nicotinate-nucleotide adenylyltransferase
MPEEQHIERLGVLGGTFDPPHYGHLLMADTARVQLGLQQVLFAPAGQPPHKPETRPTRLEHRLAMLEGALAEVDEPAFAISRVDVDRPGPHFTVDALTILERTYPAAQLWFLIGGDSLADLADWREPGQILSLARLAVLSRPGYGPDLEALAGRLSRNGVPMTAQDLAYRVDWLMEPTLDVSSTALRKRAARGLPLRFLVPGSVEAYIEKHKLYQDER